MHVYYRTLALFVALAAVPFCVSFGLCLGVASGQVVLMSLLGAAAIYAVAQDIFRRQASDDEASGEAVPVRSSIRLP